MPKRPIRSRFLAERKARPHANCLAASLEVQQRFLNSDLFLTAGSMALYSAIHNEVHTEAVAERALTTGRILVYPRIRDEHLEFVRVLTPAALTAGSFGVMEPRDGALVPVEELDLIVVPGVVFDQVGHRLGYGRGFYDRALSACRPGCKTVGFAYDAQLVASLPAAPHDKRLSALVTESHILNFDVCRPLPGRGATLKML